MNKDIKDLWTKALRSDEYEQGYGCLRKDDHYCCLGVLCDLHAKATSNQWVDDFYYMDVYTILPDQVREWAGLKSDNPEIHDIALSEWNDDCKATFHEIADLIEHAL